MNLPARTRIPQQVAVYLGTIAISLLFVTFAIRLTPSAQAYPTPTPTPLIYPTATPSTTATPAKSNTSQGPAATATPRPYNLHVPAGQPSPTPIRSIDQPPMEDPQNGETLQWAVYAPPAGVMGPDGTAHWPVIVMLHIGGYKSGDYYQALDFAPQDLAAAGFYVVVAGYPLAPPGNILGQYEKQQGDPNSGRYPQQTRAVEAFIDAARNDPHCYLHRVGVLGGSAGASHAAYVALDVSSTSGVWPFWALSQRPVCVACLSAQYDFSDRDQDVIDTTNFIPNIENYTFITVPLQQWQDSPIGLVAAAASHGFIPTYCIRASDDPGSPKSNSDYFWYTMTQAGGAPPTFYGNSPLV